MKQNTTRQNSTIMLGRKHIFSIKDAHRTQLQMSKKIIFEDMLPAKIRFIGGVDVTYVEGLSIAAVAVIEYSSLKLVESQTAISKTLMPYIPTLLSFRETQPSVLCIRKLRLQPDLFLVDGQGFAHPYRCGFASHLGLVIHRPTIGVAKTRLFGDIETPRIEDVTFLKHNGEVMGAAITSKQGSKPLYVSVGHMVSLETAIKIVKTCLHNKRIPEPLVKAHEIANTEKRKIHIPSSRYD
jgi:deoxyribonuclease V